MSEFSLQLARKKGLILYANSQRTNDNSRLYKEQRWNLRIK